MIKKIDSKTVYQNRWMKVTEDKVEFANGHQGIYGVVHKTACGLAIPYHNGKVTLVKLYRYPTGRYGWEFPMGAQEIDPTMTAQEVAKSELVEETGLVAAKVEFLGQLYFANGFSNQAFYTYLMTNLTQGDRSPEITEGLEIDSFTLTQVEELITSGDIVDGPTVSAVFLLRMKRPELFE